MWLLYGVTGFHTTEGRLSGNKTLSGLAWNKAKTAVLLISHLAAELFHGVSFMKKNIKLASAFQASVCITGWWSWWETSELTLIGCCCRRVLKLP